MVNEQASDERTKVSALLDAQLPYRKAAAINGVSIATVERVARARRMGKDHKQKSTTGTSHSRVRGKGDSQSQDLSIRQHNHELGYSHDTVRRILREYGLKSFERKKQQLLTEQSKEKGLDQ